VWAKCLVTERDAVLASEEITADFSSNDVISGSVLVAISVTCSGHVLYHASAVPEQRQF
jgi:hypothetical protein